MFQIWKYQRAASGNKGARKQEPFKKLPAYVKSEEKDRGEYS